MGEGPGEFNTALVQQATSGLAAYLTQRQVDGPVVIGFDARHGSARFAAEAAAVMQGAGRTALVLPRPLPTPVLAFAVRHLAAAAGVMITASHNPATDNGYKVYLADGAQVAPPQDAAVEAAMAAAPGPVPRAGGAGVVPEHVVEAYVARAAGLLPCGPRDLRAAYTPLHGVAGETFHRVWGAAGFEPCIEVPAQAAPDPDFPTVAFPNPEEPGALDLVMAAGADADLVLAHDPDGDRCAVGIPGYRTLTGDEVGALLAEHLLTSGRIPPDGVLATTIVSSPLLGRIAAAHGRAHVRTLTGFKWLARVPGVAYAYEEALGYCVDPAAVRDKDGITAALLVAELAARGSLLDRLDDLAHRYGVHVSAARSIRTAHSQVIVDALARLQTGPPPALAGIAVGAVTDLAASTTGLPPTPGVQLRAGPISVIARPSGTEPKLKIYLHASGPAEVADLANERTRLTNLLADAAEEIVTSLSGVTG
jgi:phosphomannomutase